MKAFVRHQYGSPDVLRLEEVDVPTPRDDKVLIQVCAASINPADWHVLTADIALVRLMGSGLFRPKQAIVGADVAGRVAALGAGVEHLQPGGEVFGSIGTGGFAEYACAEASSRGGARSGPTT